MNSKTSTITFNPDDPAQIDVHLTKDELDLRGAVREFGRREIEPHVAGWFEAGEIPGIRDLAVERGPSACSASNLKAMVARHVGR